MRHAPRDADRRWTAAAWMAVAAHALCACWNPLSECPPDDRTLADGGSVGSLTPDAILAPHLGDHPASLTWISVGRSTVLHLDVERTNAPVVALYDCDHHFGGFDVWLSGHVTTDDSTIAQTVSVKVSIDPAGTIGNFSWSWRVDGATDAGPIALYLVIPTTNLTPTDGVVKDDRDQVVGMVHFGP